jgi:hypothetical protein
MKTRPTHLKDSGDGLFRDSNRFKSGRAAFPPPGLLPEVSYTRTRFGGPAIEPPSERPL